jgi:hypothetical protein
VSLSEEKGEWEGLLSHPGWKRLEEIMREQIRMRHEQIMLKPLAGHDAVFEQEFTKGEAAMASLILTMPHTIVEQLLVDIEQAAKFAEGNKDEPTDA